MGIQVHQIQFCWNPANPSGSAISIRKNAEIELPNPEWTQGRNFTFNDSRAAYAINPIKGKKVFIKASFKTKDPALFNKEVEIRAVQPPMAHQFNPLLSVLVNFLQVVISTQVNVLGEVKARKIKFNVKGESSLEPFELMNHRLVERGVGISPVKWFWQFRTGPGHPWQNLGSTEHQIFSILEMPRGPWSGLPGQEGSQPWTDVLEYACYWARGARTLNGAASLITNAIYNLGPGLLEYNCSTFLPGYVVPVNLRGDAFFNCSAFIHHLKTGRGTRYVICTDCAAIVSTFSNILGCNLWQSKMYTKGVTFFKVNPILAIGSFSWKQPCGVPGFAYHEVAWNNECTPKDEIFDACLALDRDFSPSFYPHIPYLPANQVFGNMGDGLYRDRLAAPSDIIFCKAQPGDRVQRPLSPQQLSFARGLVEGKGFHEDRTGILKKRTSFSEWENQNKLKENLFIFQHKTPDYLLADWELSFSFASEWVPGMPRMAQEMWRPKSKVKKQAIQITKYECASRKEAHESMIRFLTDVHVQIDYEEITDLGDVAYATPSYGAVIFARGNLLMILANADKDRVNLKKLADEIDATLISKGGLVRKSRSAVKRSVPLSIDRNVAAKKGDKIPILLQGTGARVAKKQAKGVFKSQAIPTKLENLRFFSKNDEIIIENQQLLIVPGTKSRDEPAVEVFGKMDGEDFQMDLK